MEHKAIRDLFGWVPSRGKPNYRKVTAGHTEYLQILVSFDGFPTYACIPLRGRPDMSNPHGHETFLDFLRARVEAYTRSKGTDEGFQLSEADLAEIRDEILDFYRRRRFLLEAATPAREFEVVVRDGDHALKLMEMLDRYSPDSDQAWTHRKYEPYIKCHMIQARLLQLLDAGDYRAAVTAAREGIAAIAEFDRGHEAWEYSEMDESIHPRSLIGHLEEMVVKLLGEAQQQAVEKESYESAALIRDLLTGFDPNDRL
ncbi:MAG: hypothetical protein KAX44_07820 [Candidatus Brocadiae bacterium]|nr:hypothetical protein [Candidatus Brocadiia bacterium]